MGQSGLMSSQSKTDAMRIFLGLLEGRVISFPLDWNPEHKAEAAESHLSMKSVRTKIKQESQAQGAGNIA